MANRAWPFGSRYIVIKRGARRQYASQGLHQRIIEQLGLESTKRQNAPMDDSVRLMQDAEPSMKPYHEAIGCIMYLVVGTHPDLAFSVSTLAKFVKSPTTIDWVAAQGVLKYSLSTKRFGI